MKDYKIKHAGETMVIWDRETNESIAEYRLTTGREVQEMAQMRRAIDKHLAKPGNGLGNYQW